MPELGTSGSVRGAAGNGRPYRDGWMRLREGEGFIEITHGAYPLVPQDESRRSWLVPILEGLYGGWLAEQGGDSSFTARLAGQPKGSGTLLTFRYGRHE